MIPAALNSAQFAEHIETIKMLYSADDDFKTLCDDYATSKITVEKFNVNSLEDVKNKMEYEQLSVELEKEILEYVLKIS